RLKHVHDPSHPNPVFLAGRFVLSVRSNTGRWSNPPPQPSPPCYSSTGLTSQPTSSKRSFVASSFRISDRNFCLSSSLALLHTFRRASRALDFSRVGFDAFGFFSAFATAFDCLLGGSPASSLIFSRVRAESPARTFVRNSVPQLPARVSSCSAKSLSLRIV